MAATVSSTMWSIDCLLDRLPAGPQYRGLRHDLEDINRHLRRCRPWRGAAVTAPVRLWTKLLREIAYDVEDCWLDGRRPWRRLLGLVLCPWRQRARIQGFRDRFQRLHDLGTGLDLVGGGAAASDLLPPVPTSDNDDDDDVPAGGGEGKLPPPPRGLLVGLDGPESELVKHLVVDGKERGWKVVCILGPGGVGKTSLARELLRKLRGHFDCVAFVYVGWNPSVTAVQMDVASQVMPAESLLPCDEKTITKRLWKFLSTRRYLIVGDDIWKTRSWNSITCAFPFNGLGSRIVATTEFEHMARFSCVRRTDLVYLLKPLSYCDSKSLMLSRMCVPKEDCVLDSNNLHDVLRICGGSPLALVVMAGLVAAKRSGLFELSSMAAPTSSIWSVTHEMGKILDMSFVDLPLRVKPCFLYLSMFPENHTIMKDRLIRRWIAEGFIPTRNGERLWDTGESYFSELARRGLIELVLDDSDEQIGCTVHSVIHEFILSLSTEENFAIVGDRLSYDSYPGNTVRRFALDCNNKIESGILASYTKHLSRVRSLALSGNTNQQMSDVSAFKLVRVLDLEGATGLGKHQLRSIGSLFLLRYLGLRGSDVSMLPEKMKALEHLAAIDIRQTKVKHLPEFNMGKLVSLLADCVMIPSGMTNMLQLEELSMLLVGHRSSMDNASNLVEKSKLLRVLGVRIEHCDDRVGLMHFLTAVDNSNLQTLFVDDYSGLFLDSLLFLQGQKSSCHLQKFELNVSHSPVQKVPVEIAYLKDLTHLHIVVYELEAEGLHALEGLPNLVLLHLDSHDTQERCIISKKNSSQGCFQCLRVFSLRCLDSGMGLQFGPGVMPQLRRFQLVFSTEEMNNKFGGFDFGIEHLTCLEQVSVTINCSAHTSHLKAAAEVAIKDQVSQIPNNPLLQLKIRDQSCLD